MTESFPLKWPLGRERTASYSRKKAPFATTPGRARDELLHELRLLGASDVVISSNVATYRRGGQDIMYADQSQAKSDPGVAVYYTWKGEQYALACDRWTTVMDNLQALNKTVDAIRGIDRWGTGEMMKAAFAGFKALAERASTIDIWTILDMEPTKNKEQITRRYRELAMKYSNDESRLRELNGARDAAYQLAIR